MRFYTGESVLEAAINRINWLFDEFDTVTVNWSGGKDSTVILALCLDVAEKRGRLPLPVLWIDQEAEWQATVDISNTVMSDPRVMPIWLQVPFRIFNATSFSDCWLHAWQPGAQWMREKSPLAIHENPTGKDRFIDLFLAPNYVLGAKSVNIAGVRAEESPARLRGLTTFETYGGVTWGKKANGNLDFYPIYDWGWRDVWKFIHERRLEYNKIYDYMYQYSVPINEMRVSNLNHETATKSLYYLHELEAETWDRLTARLQGVNTVGQMKEQWITPDKLPYMFASWKEYRDYLLENLWTDEEKKALMRRRFAAHEGRYIQEVEKRLNRTEVAMILVNDYHGTKYTTFHAAHGLDAIKLRLENGKSLTGKWQGASP